MEANCAEPFPLVRVPCFQLPDYPNRFFTALLKILARKKRSITFCCRSVSDQMKKFLTIDGSKFCSADRFAPPTFITMDEVVEHIETSHAESTRAADVTSFIVFPFDLVLML